MQPDQITKNGTYIQWNIIQQQRIMKSHHFQENE